MSNNNQKNFKQVTISSFFKTKEVVNESPSFKNVSLNQFKKVKEQSQSLKRPVANDDIIINNAITDNLPPTKRRNIYKNYHNALQKFKFSVNNNSNSDKEDKTTSFEKNFTTEVKATSQTNKKTLINIDDLSKFSSNIQSSPQQSPVKPLKKKDYTPLEQQYLKIKERNPNMLLAIEVGYKYRFFDEDAFVSFKFIYI